VKNGRLFRVAFKSGLEKFKAGK